MLEIKHTWTSTGSSGGLTPAEVRFGAVESVMYIQNSTLASTQSISFQTAISSGGPWVTEATSTISTGVASADRLRVTGPFHWVRPFIHSASTGTYTITLTGVS